MADCSDREVVKDCPLCLVTTKHLLNDDLIPVCQLCVVRTQTFPAKDDFFQPYSETMEYFIREIETKSEDN